MSEKTRTMELKYSMVRSTDALNLSFQPVQNGKTETPLRMRNRGNSDEVFLAPQGTDRGQGIGGKVPRADGSGSGWNGCGEPGWGDRPVECPGGEAVRVPPRLAFV